MSQVLASDSVKACPGMTAVTRLGLCHGRDAIRTNHLGHGASAHQGCSPYRW